MVDALFSQVQHAVLRDQVANAIRSAIATGALESGSRLVESEIAGRMGVSKAPVREALRLLEAEGLVSTAPHRATFVTKLSPADVREIHSVRGCLERLAVGLLVDRADGEALAELRRIVGTMRRAKEAGDLALLKDADFRFHQLIVQRSGNSRAALLWSGLQGLIRMFMAQKNALHASPVVSVTRHEALLAVIESGDRAAAQTLLEQHVNEACQDLEALAGAAEVSAVAETAIITRPPAGL